MTRDRLDVRYSRRAEADVERIGDWIAKDSPRRALTYVVELQAYWKTPGDMPDRYPIAKKVAGRTLRKAGFPPFVIFFVADAREVVVVRVLHGRRDIARMLPRL